MHGVAGLVDLLLLVDNLVSSREQSSSTFGAQLRHRRAQGREGRAQIGRVEAELGEFATWQRRRHFLEQSKIFGGRAEAQRAQDDIVAAEDLPDLAHALEAIGAHPSVEVGAARPRGRLRAMAHLWVQLAVDLEDAHAVLTLHDTRIARGPVGAKEEQQTRSVGCVGCHDLERLVQSGDVITIKCRTALANLLELGDQRRIERLGPDLHVRRAAHRDEGDHHILGGARLDLRLDKIMDEHLVEGLRARLVAGHVLFAHGAAVVDDEHRM